VLLRVFVLAALARQLAYTLKIIKSCKAAFEPNSANLYDSQCHAPGLHCQGVQSLFLSCVPTASRPTRCALRIWRWMAIVSSALLRKTSINEHRLRPAIV